MNSVTYARARLDCLRRAGTLTLLTALLVGGSYEAAGIIIRHDRDDARYLEFYDEGDAAFWVEHAAGRGTPVKYVARSEFKISVLVRLTSAVGKEAG